MDCKLAQVNEVSSDDVLIEQITISATSFQNIQSSTLENGVNYYLKVTGVYGFGGWSGTSFDGAFAHTTVILMRQHRLGFGHGMVQLIKHLRRMNIILIMNIIFTLQVQVQMNSLVLKI